MCGQPLLTGTEFAVAFYTSEFSEENTSRSLFFMIAYDKGIGLVLFRIVNLVR